MDGAFRSWLTYTNCAVIPPLMLTLLTMTTKLLLLLLLSKAGVLTRQP